MNERAKMTVGQLREILSQIDPALPVFLADWNEEYLAPCHFYTDEFSLREGNFNGKTVRYLCLGNDGKTQGV